MQDLGGSITSEDSMGNIRVRAGVGGILRFLRMQVRREQRLFEEDE